MAITEAIIKFKVKFLSTFFIFLRQTSIESWAFRRVQPPILLSTVAFKTVLKNNEHNAFS